MLYSLRASIRQRSRSQLSNLIPESSVPIVGELGPRAYAVSKADKVRAGVGVFAYILTCGRLKWGLLGTLRR